MHRIFLFIKHDARYGRFIPKIVTAVTKPGIIQNSNDNHSRLMALSGTITLKH